jgi:hypothetical protein
MALSQNITVSCNAYAYGQWKNSYQLQCEQCGLVFNDERISAPSKLATERERLSKIDATETDMVEIALAFHAADVFPGQSQEAIIDRVRVLSGLAMENWVQLGANIRRRGSLKFLARLMKFLSAHNEEVEENGRANRRPNLLQK